MAVSDYKLWMLVSLVAMIVFSIVILVIVSVSYSDISRIVNNPAAFVNVTALSTGSGSSSENSNVAWVQSSDCDDGNDCTVDVASTFGSYRGCKNLPVPNNYSCTNDCLIVGSGTCKAGVCSGLCKGYCPYYINFEETACPALPFSSDVQAEIDAFTLFYGSLCFYGRCLHFLQWPIVNDWNCAGGATPPYLQEDYLSECSSFLDHNHISPDCLEVDVLCTSDNKPICVYRYGCSGLNVFNPLEIVPTPALDAGFTTPETVAPVTEPESLLGNTQRIASDPRSPMPKVSTKSKQESKVVSKGPKTTLVNPNFKSNGVGTKLSSSPKPSVPLSGILDVKAKGLKQTTTGGTPSSLKQKSADYKQISTHNGFLLKHGKKREEVETSGIFETEENAKAPDRNSQTFVSLRKEQTRRQGGIASEEWYDEMANAYVLKRQSIGLESFTALEIANEDVISALGTSTLLDFIDQAFTQFIATLNTSNSS